MSHFLGSVELVCPRCKQDLKSVDAALGCDAGHRFPVLRGIPRFCPPSTYADSFGFEWTSFPVLQLDSERSTASAETFAEKTGLQPIDVRGKSVLDAGCGMGRFSDVVARWGAATVVAADLSRSVEAAAANLRGHDAVTVVQADLHDLPLREESFDVVFSIGVLHHTPDTFEALRRIARFVKPGGVLCTWVYCRRLRLSLAGGEVLRLYTRAMEPERLLRLVERTVAKMDLLRSRFPRLSRAIELAIPVSRHPDRDWRILDTFDWYSPRYQHKHSYAEVEDWYRRLGFEEIERGPFPVSVRGRRQDVRVEGGAEDVSVAR